MNSGVVTSFYIQYKQLLTRLQLCFHPIVFHFTCIHLLLLLLHALKLNVNIVKSPQILDWSTSPTPIPKAVVPQKNMVPLKNIPQV